MGGDGESRDLRGGQQTIFAPDALAQHGAVSRVHAARTVTLKLRVDLAAVETAVGEQQRGVLGWSRADEHGTARQEASEPTQSQSGRTKSKMRNECCSQNAEFDPDEFE